MLVLAASSEIEPRSKRSVGQGKIDDHLSSWLQLQSSLPLMPALSGELQNQEGSYSRFADGLPNLELFATLAEAKVIVATYVKKYN